MEQPLDQRIGVAIQLRRADCAKVGEVDHGSPRCPSEPGTEAGGAQTGHLERELLPEMDSVADSPVAQQ